MNFYYLPQNHFLFGPTVSVVVTPTSKPETTVEPQYGTSTTWTWTGHHKPLGHSNNHPREACGKLAVYLLTFIPVYRHSLENINESYTLYYRD